MTKNYPGEKWEKVKLDFEYVNDNRIEVSNFGRVRTFNKKSDGNILKLSTVKGYQIIHFKFLKARDPKVDFQADLLKQQIFELARHIKQLKTDGGNKAELGTAERNLIALSKKKSKLLANATKKRSINYHSLIHRLVANHFLDSPLEGQTIVAHKDHDRLNNRSNNLRWMTPAQNVAHQMKSPHVIKEKQERQVRVRDNPTNTKLTVTKVMLLKKMLNQGKPMKQLVKLFKVSDTQILRIKRGENWKRIEAAQ